MFLAALFLGALVLALLLVGVFDRFVSPGALVGVAVDLQRGLKIIATGGGWRPLPIVDI